MRKLWRKIEDLFPDGYHMFMLRLYEWRRGIFPWWYRWRMVRRHRRDMMEKFGFVPGVGDAVEDCRMKVLKIIEVDAEDPDMVTLEDGATCSLWHCCDLPGREYA